MSVKFMLVRMVKGKRHWMSCCAHDSEGKLIKGGKTTNRADIERAVEKLKTTYPNEQYAVLECDFKEKNKCK